MRIGSPISPLYGPTPAIDRHTHHGIDKIIWCSPGVSRSVIFLLRFFLLSKVSFVLPGAITFNFFGSFSFFFKIIFINFNTNNVITVPFNSTLLRQLFPISFGKRSFPHLLSSILCAKQKLLEGSHTHTHSTQINK